MRCAGPSFSGNRVNSAPPPTNLFTSPPPPLPATHYPPPTSLARPPPNPLSRPPPLHLPPPTVPPPFTAPPPSADLPPPSKYTDNSYYETTNNNSGSNYSEPPPPLAPTYNDNSYNSEYEYNKSSSSAPADTYNNSYEANSGGYEQSGPGYEDGYSSKREYENYQDQQYGATDSSGCYQPSRPARRPADDARSDLRSRLDREQVSKSDTDLCTYQHHY